MYEKLDPNLVEQLNDITNEDVRAFHRDNFLRFRDFKLYLKRDEIMSQLNVTRDQVTQEYQVDKQFSKS